LINEKYGKKNLRIINNIWKNINKNILKFNLNLYYCF
jgi:hypothetical protein